MPTNGPKREKPLGVRCLRGLCFCRILTLTLSAIGIECTVSLDEAKRRSNEKKFPDWEDLPNGGRRYFYTVQGRSGWTARYVKEVDAKENTLRFYQEIYNEQGELVEIHHKYPVDTGHQPVEQREEGS